MQKVQVVSTSDWTANLKTIIQLRRLRKTGFLPLVGVNSQPARVLTITDCSFQRCTGLEILR